MEAVKCFNATFVVLVPKKDHAEAIKDYRPISLLNGSYKIITKSVASRLKGVITKLVDNNQSAFMRGRSILGKLYGSLRVYS